MRLARSVLLLALVGLPAAFAACATSSTTLLGSWRSPSYTSGSLHGPLVVAVADRSRVRVRLEDELVLALRGIGVDALSSHTVFPARVPTVAEIKDELPSTHRDSVMVTHLVDVKLETVVVPGGPVGPDQDWATYYMDRYNVVRTPDYTYTRKTLELETSLYDAATNQIVWRAVTESEQPSSLDDALASFARVVVADVQKNRVLAPP
jgi:hypothetical protein